MRYGSCGCAPIVSEVTLGDVSDHTPVFAFTRVLTPGYETPDTLRAMKAFARHALRSPTQTVRETTLGCISQLPERSWRWEIMACHQFVRDRIKYVRDPDGFELVQTPEKTLHYGVGDCDDKSTLLASMLLSIGHPCRFVAVGFRGEEYSHVFVEAKLGERWWALETILPVEAGWEPPDSTSRLTYNV